MRLACVRSWGNELRCHELARAILSILDEDPINLEVVDGHCGPVEHSWLRYGDGLIIDAYAPGRLPAVQIVDPLVGSGYRPGPERRDIRHAVVARLVAEMRGVVSES